MQTLIHADIFFFITTIAVIILIVLAAVAAFYVIRILQSVRYIVDKIRKESDHVSEDIAELREHIKHSGTKFSSMARTLGAFFLGRAMKHRRKKAEHED